MIFPQKHPGRIRGALLNLMYLSRCKAYKIPCRGMQKLGRNMVKTPIDICFHNG